MKHKLTPAEKRKGLEKLAKNGKGGLKKWAQQQLKKK